MPTADNPFILPKGPPPPRPDQRDLDTASQQKARRQPSHATTACNPCQRSKRKCDQNRPCSHCATKGLNCIYDESKDGRRGRKRVLDGLHAKAEAFDVAVESLRTSDHESALALLRLIREGAPVDEITSQAKDYIDKSSSTTASQENLSAERARQAALSITALCDIPVVDVPAQPWTTETTDDGLASHLVSLYFTWQNTYFSCLDKTVFADAMKLKDPSSLLCSPLLVNAVLFMGCMYSDHPSVFAVPNDPASRGVHFMDEALRLWALEEGKTSLTNLQSLLILAVGLMFNGKDRVSMQYLAQSVYMASELTARVKKSLQNGNKEAYSSKEFQLSLSCALWGGFVSQTGLGIAWMKSVGAKKPRFPRPYTGSDLSDKALWQPYPDLDPKIEYSSFGLLDQLFSLHEIGLDILPLLLSGNAVDTPNCDFEILDRATRLARVRDLEQRLEKWHRQLPQAISSPETLKPRAPAEMDLLLTYHAWRIALNNMVLADTAPAGEDEKSFDSSNLSYSVLRGRARAQVLSSAKSIATHTDEFRATFGRKHFSMYETQASMTVVWSVMDMLQEAEVQDVFHSLLVTVSVTARRALIVRGFSRMILGTLQQRGLERHLSEASKTLLRLNAVDTWGPDDHELFKSVTYPNVVVAREEGRILADMGDLLQKWAKLDLAEEDSEKEKVESS